MFITRLTLWVDFFLAALTGSGAADEKPEAVTARAVAIADAAMKQYDVREAAMLKETMQDYQQSNPDRKPLRELWGSGSQVRR